MVGNIIGATISAAGTLAGAYAQAKAQERINEKNLKYQEEANRLSIDLANTAHQREIEDLRAAGLNPILSAGGSGAQTPSIGAVQADNPYSGLGNSASAVSREIGRLFTDQMALSNEQAEAQIVNTRAQKLQIESDAALKQAMADSIRDAQGIVKDFKEEVSPEAAAFGGWLGNSAFETKEKIKDFYHKYISRPEQSDERYPYKGRRMTAFQIWEDDPEHYEENMKRIRLRSKK